MHDMPKEEEKRTEVDNDEIYQENTKDIDKFDRIVQKEKFLIDEDDDDEDQI